MSTISYIIYENILMIGSKLLNQSSEKIDKKKAWYIYHNKYKNIITMTEQIDFKKLCKEFPRNIDLFDTKLMNKLNIIPLPTPPELYDKELIYKNILQTAILNYQYNQILKMYTAIRDLDTQGSTHIKNSTKKRNEIRNLDHHNHATIKKYSIIDSLSLIQKYKNTHSIITPDEISRELAYIQKLLLVSIAQQFIVGNQYNIILSTLKNLKYD